MMILLLCLGFVLIGLSFDMGELVNLICLIFFGLGGIILVIGFISSLVSKPGIIIDFDKREVTIHSAPSFSFRQKTSMTINFDDIYKMKFKSQYLQSCVVVYTKTEHESKLSYNGNKKCFVAMLMYINTKSKKQLKAAVDKINALNEKNSNKKTSDFSEIENN